MKTYLTPAILFFVLVALLVDISIHARPVHAQSNMYVDQVAAQGSVHQAVKARGSDFVAFSCSGEFCYILSK